MTLTVQIIEPALKINVLILALSTVLVAKVQFVKLPPTDLCVAVQVDGQVTHTLNVTNVG